MVLVQTCLTLSIKSWPYFRPKIDVENWSLFGPSDSVQILPKNLHKKLGLFINKINKFSPRSYVCRHEFHNSYFSMKMCITFIS